jgi:dTMP kinase
MKKAKYICIEGTEGVGKTTQCQLLYEYLKSKGYSVLATKEPGTIHAPLTMVLRGIMLDNQYDGEMTAPAREFISQAIRSIHIKNVILPAMPKYDFILQDRGILSGYAYGEACGNDMDLLRTLSNTIVDEADPNSVFFPPSAERIYDKVIYLRGDVESDLTRALSSKKEFETGDAMESRGNRFMQRVSYNMDYMTTNFNTLFINVNGKSIEDVHQEIINALEIRDI